MVRTGCQWQLLPEKYGSWRAVHRRFKRWNDKGVWQDFLTRTTIDARMETIMIDSTIIRSHACSGGYKKDSEVQECFGPSKGGFRTKIHAVVDALGNPLQFILTAGQRNDITQTESLIQGLNNTMVIADKGYDSNGFIEAIKRSSSTPVIPSKKNRKTKRAYDTNAFMFIKSNI